MSIKLIYSSVDGYRTKATFKTLKNARHFAHKWIGEHPSIGTGYAVSDDGIGKIVVYGDATLADLFPANRDVNDLKGYPLPLCTHIPFKW